MDYDNTAGDIVIREFDGTLGRRSLSTFQTKRYIIGDFAHGGIVFWVDETGEHGLVCALSDQSTGIRWHAGTNGNTQAKGDGPGAGKNNTAIIIAAQVAIGDDGELYAARICNELYTIDINLDNRVSYNHGDWYLPSIKELQLIGQNRLTIDETAEAPSRAAYIKIRIYSERLSCHEMPYLSSHHPNFFPKP